jgi:hypothetical protein
VVGVGGGWGRSVRDFAGRVMELGKRMFERGSNET